MTNQSNIWVWLVTLVYWTLKKDHNQLNFVDSIKSFCQQIFKANSEQIWRHCLSSKCHESFKMRTSFVTVIMPFLKLRKWERPWEPGWAETQLQLRTQNLNNCSHPIKHPGKTSKVEWAPHSFKHLLQRRGSACLKYLELFKSVG